MRFASVVGARPQFIKLAPVSRALRRLHTEFIIHTGQHYDDFLSGAFWRELRLPAPDVHLGIGSGPHGAQTGQMLARIEELLARERPDGVLVYGDTNSTLAGALAAAKLRIPLAHVEAGLRSYNRAMPEEINRVVTDHLSDRLFCPTEAARAHAALEGITASVEVVGDVMYDLLLEAQPLLEERAAGLLPALDIDAGGYIVATVHRAGNTDDPAAMRSIVAALNRLDAPVVLPLHPRTRQALERDHVALGERVRALEPMGYLDMLTLQLHASRVVTDSGGVQKEAFLLGVPCVTLREETEWSETVEAGWNTLAGCSEEAIIAAARRPPPPPPAAHLFGRGDAATRIARSLCDWPP